MTADVGVGHTSAAKALRNALALSTPDLESTIVDSYKFSAAMFSRVVSNGYLGLVKTIPQMYRFIYARAEKATDVGPFRAWVHQFTASNIRPFLTQYAPDVVVCTHAFPCGVMAEYKHEFADAPPVFGVVTDFAVHAFWIHANVDGYAVATDQMRQQLIARGVDPQRIVASGIPISPEFGETSRGRDQLARRLELPPDRRIVLVMGGGLGIAPLETIMRALAQVDDSLCAVVIVGRSRRAEARALECAARMQYPVRVLRFVDNVHDYMHAADLLVTKPGGLTSSEALAAGVPLLLFKPLPGQEERNTRFLVSGGAAVRAKKSEDLAQRVQMLLRDVQKRERMRVAMAALAKPNAAADAAAAIRRVAGARGERIA
ncbi:MAG TPA: glycosyltransferase [Candidatus Baltobacteraceae bacterium]|nr:glycosyltransferase [Candidatus Baltobacteraceae bacterium]